ncbi:MAG: hypothetical protein EPN62_20225, partial [Candidimonas sp.]
MLILKSAQSLASPAPDRLAIHAPADLPKLAKARGWPHAVLADERTMASALDFLDAGKKEHMPVSAGMQVSELSTQAGRVTLVFIPLDQAGLHRLISLADSLALCDTLDACSKALAPSAATDGSKPNLAVMILPGRGFNPARADLVKQALGHLGLGLAVGLASVWDEELRHAPRQTAIQVATDAHIALAELRFAYSEEPFDKALSDALISITKDADTHRRKSRLEDSQPQTFEDPTIPFYRPVDETNAAQRNADKIASRFGQMTLSRDPYLPAKAGLKEGDDSNAILLDLANQGYAIRVAAGLLADTQEARDRLAEETGLIVKLGFSNYFL